MEFQQYTNKKGVQVWARRRHIGRENAFDLCVPCKRIDCPIESFRSAVKRGHQVTFITWECAEFLNRPPIAEKQKEIDPVFAQAE